MHLSRFNMHGLAILCLVFGNSARSADPTLNPKDCGNKFELVNEENQAPQPAPKVESEPMTPQLAVKRIASYFNESLENIKTPEEICAYLRGDYLPESIRKMLTDPDSDFAEVRRTYISRAHPEISMQWLDVFIAQKPNAKQVREFLGLYERIESVLSPQFKRSGIQDLGSGALMVVPAVLKLGRAALDYAKTPAEWSAVAKVLNEFQIDGDFGIVLKRQLRRQLQYNMVHRLSREPGFLDGMLAKNEKSDVMVAVDLIDAMNPLILPAEIVRKAYEQPDAWEAAIHYIEIATHEKNKFKVDAGEFKQFRLNIFNTLISGRQLHFTSNEASDLARAFGPELTDACALSQTIINKGVVFIPRRMKGRLILRLRRMIGLGIIQKDQEVLDSLQQ